MKEDNGERIHVSRSSLKAFRWCHWLVHHFIDTQRRLLYIQRFLCAKSVKPSSETLDSFRNEYLQLGPKKLGPVRFRTMTAYQIETSDYFFAVLKNMQKINQITSYVIA